MNTNPLNREDGVYTTVIRGSGAARIVPTDLSLLLIGPPYRIEKGIKLGFVDANSLLPATETVVGDVTEASTTITGIPLETLKKLSRLTKLTDTGLSIAGTSAGTIASIDIDAGELEMSAVGAATEDNAEITIAYHAEDQERVWLYLDDDDTSGVIKPREGDFLEDKDDIKLYYIDADGYTNYLTNEVAAAKIAHNFNADAANKDSDSYFRYVVGSGAGVLPLNTVVYADIKTWRTGTKGFKSIRSFDDLKYWTGEKSYLYKESLTAYNCKKALDISAGTGTIRVYFPGIDDSMLRIALDIERGDDYYIVPLIKMGAWSITDLASYNTAIDVFKDHVIKMSGMIERKERRLYISYPIISTSATVAADYAEDKAVYMDRNNLLTAAIRASQIDNSLVTMIAEYHAVDNSGDIEGCDIAVCIAAQRLSLSLGHSTTRGMVLGLNRIRSATFWDENDAEALTQMGWVVFLQEDNGLPEIYHQSTASLDSERNEESNEIIIHKFSKDLRARLHSKTGKGTENRISTDPAHPMTKQYENAVKTATASLVDKYVRNEWLASAIYKGVVPDPEYKDVAGIFYEIEVYHPVNRINIKVIVVA